MHSGIQGILLAAGRSQRFGGDKRFAPIAGRPMALHTALRWKEAMGQGLLVVLRADDVELAALLAAQDIAYTHCPDASQGMGHSLAHGVRCRARASGWVVGLADMPQLRPSTVLCVARALGPGRIVVPTCDGVRGHPVGFDAVFGPALMALKGDQGARALLLAHPQALHPIEQPDPGMLIDVDRPDQIPDAGARC